MFAACYGFAYEVDVDFRLSARGDAVEQTHAVGGETLAYGVGGALLLLVEWPLVHALYGFQRA